MWKQFGSSQDVVTPVIKFSMKSWLSAWEQLEGSQEPWNTVSFDNLAIMFCSGTDWRWQDSVWSAVRIWGTVQSWWGELAVVWAPRGPAVPGLWWWWIVLSLPSWHSHTLSQCISGPVAPSHSQELLMALINHPIRLQHTHIETHTLLQTGHSY